MPSHKSAAKRIITSEKARHANRTVRTSIRASMKKIRAAEKKETILAEIPKLFSLLDKAARRAKAGITKNTSANYKRKAHKILAGKA